MAAFKRELIRLTFVLHRYVGMALGLLMLMWCLSGVVMMYVSYPALEAADREHGLTPIDWSRCCILPATGIDDSALIRGFEIEMLGARPVLRLTPELGSPRMIDLSNGAMLSGVRAADAKAVAGAYGKSHGSQAEPSLMADIHNDQWSVYGGFDDDRPLLRYAVNDMRGTQLYVSSVTGKAVQVTTASERFWNWLGAIPHWLYFVQLRQNNFLWTQVIVYSSLVGCFLTATGIYIGFRQWNRARRAARWSPYRGFMFWHHVPGLIFGLFTLTWVASGLFSMNPWGLFENGSARMERAKLQGPPIAGLLLRATLDTLPQARLDDAIVSVASAPLDGQLYLIATKPNGERLRFDPTGAAAPLAPPDLRTMASAVAGDGPVPALERITEEDSYYFSHHKEVVTLPAYRLVRDDAESTRYYFDAVSGQLLSKVDAGGREYRWLHEGLHRFDFFAALRARPLWDIVMLVLMAGVTFVCGTGAYIGLRFMIGRPVRSRKPIL